MNVINGLWPGEVASYDAPSRICRVRIVGITEGSTDLPEAVFNNALGDRAPDTEIRILADDPVWLMFEAGDPRFPIIMGYRTPRAGNPVNWRRWQHANIEMTADGVFRVNAKNIEINGITTINGVTTVNGATAINATIAVSDMASLNGGLSSTGGAAMAGALTNNGVNVGSSHTHTEQGDGQEVSTPH